MSALGQQTFAMQKGNPVCPRKRTCAVQLVMSALGQKRTFPLSAPWRALSDDVDDFKRHHHFAGLINYLNERGDRAAIGL
jgi:hypothetical protein